MKKQHNADRNEKKGAKASINTPELSEADLAKVTGGTTTIGSATGGAGAGKVKFNDFTFTRKVDSSTP